jgi:hypothetical protein
VLRARTEERRILDFAFMAGVKYPVLDSQDPWGVGFFFDKMPLHSGAGGFRFDVSHRRPMSTAVKIQL